MNVYIQTSITALKISANLDQRVPLKLALTNAAHVQHRLMEPCAIKVSRNSKIYLRFEDFCFMISKDFFETKASKALLLFQLATETLIWPSCFSVEEQCTENDLKSLPTLRRR